MTDEEFIAYRDGRYKQAMEFYDKRAGSNKRWYRFFSVYILASSVAIAPILTINSELHDYGRIIAGILAPTVALATGLSSKFNFHEYWLNYRATWDALHHEAQWHLARVGPYANIDDRNARFVERVEQIISREGTDWVAREADSNQSKEAQKRIG